MFEYTEYESQKRKYKQELVRNDISWGDESSFEFCFDGVGQGATVAVCTYY